MSTIEIVSKIEALKEWEALAEEAAAEIESLRDDIKKEMDGRGRTVHRTVYHGAEQPVRH